MDEKQHVAGAAAEGADKADDGLLVVIGAGAAGLSAARTARDQGRTVVVLEASDRAGGRIWTDHSLGFAAELGANFIHGASNQNPLTRLAKKTGPCLTSVCRCLLIGAASPALRVSESFYRCFLVALPLFLSQNLLQI